MERYLKIDSLKQFIIKVLEANNISKNSGQVETSAEELAASAEQLSNQVQQFHI